MENEQSMTLSTQASWSSEDGLCCVHEQVLQLQNNLYQLQLERDRLQTLVTGFEDTDTRYRQLLSRECTVHSLTRDQLQTEKASRAKTTQANMQLHCELVRTHAAQVVAERAFAWEKGSSSENCH
ncbi:hypothetical protein I7I51_05358 [Histoplasma capsulatum]|uniref:Uncharacterized protein n=1 Tax=Ajellomyces capsulatus TaxID=5037 RepID=A0A8A1M279_AJECA|nr:hypothetical protein I7I51_05358 [Histoplasma capsulatum]